MIALPPGDGVDDEPEDVAISAREAETMPARVMFVRELMLAVAASQAPAPGTKASLQAVEDAVLPLRQKVAAVLAAASQAELDAIP